jgi:DNA (cytosine-5)-methyltransferase 1
VLAHQFPAVTNFGDMTQFKDWDIEPGSIDILVGGTPCQSFSIAGLRGGLEDDRGNLALTYCRILDRFKPRWFVWENVPGVLSSNGGRDFGSILGAMVELGYGIDYRILDAQYFGVPQRRRRVFVVGCLGDWRSAAEVLFEPGCVRGDTKTGGKKRKDVAGTLASRTSAGGGLGTDFDLDGGLVAAPVTQLGPIAGTLTRRHDSSPCHDRGQNIVVTSTGRTSHCLNAGGMGRQDYETETMVVSIQERAVSTNETNGPQGSGFRTDGKAYTLDARNKVQAVAFSGRNRGDDGRGYDRPPNVTGSVAGTVDTVKPGNIAGPTIGVRRLTPIECERLQGFPDNWTQVPYRNRPACDGPRYKAIGNSMAVPVMRWIGQRLHGVNAARYGRETANA